MGASYEEVSFVIPRKDADSLGDDDEGRTHSRIGAAVDSNPRQMSGLPSTGLDKKPMKCVGGVFEPLGCSNIVKLDLRPLVAISTHALIARGHPSPVGCDQVVDRLPPF